MRLLATTAIVLVLGATGAIAADAPETIMIDDEAIDMASDWNGLYAGVGVTVGSAPTVPENFVQGEVIIGGNVQADMFVFGAEAWLGGFASDLPAQAIVSGASVRGGILATPEVLIYGSLGVQSFDFGNVNYGQVGAGVEVLVSEDMSIDFEGKWWREIGGGLDVFSVSASALWHFN